MAKGARSNSRKKAGALRKQMCAPFETQQIDKLKQKLDAIRGVHNELNMGNF
jgi:pyruvate/2-oxoacid:ferredoxin oxidoreductase alpha subunit